MSLSRRAFLQHATASSAVLALGGLAAAAEPAKSAWPDNPFLQGNWKPVSEETTADNLKVAGALPKELDGMFVRNGPNPQFPPIANYHLFEGDGMLHGVRIQGGKASYRNRYVRTEAYQREKKAGKAVYPSFLDKLDFKQLAELGGFPNRANTALVWHDRKLLCLWEGGPPTEVKVPSLETVGLFTYDGKLKHAFTAHPKVDPQTGEMLFFGYQPMKPFVQYGVADAKGAITHTTPIELPRGVMMHDFAITPKHALFLDFPETFSIERMLKGEPPFKWEPEHGARIGVLPRQGKGDAVRWFDVKPCFVFHILNAFEEGDTVELLASRMKEFPGELGFDPKTKGTTPTQILTSAAPYMYRWRLDLKTGKTSEEQVDDVVNEFPRINETLTGRKTRYGYAARAGGEWFDGLLKFDFEKRKTQVFAYAKGTSGGEPVFVPRPGGKGEDDGWLLTFTHDAIEGKSELLLVNAATMQPDCRVAIPARVPHGFHGGWAPT
jgi:carotenoid cleavage dioxygenase